MAKCIDCNKVQQTGHRLSINRKKVSRRANRVFKPNVKKVHVVEGGTHKTVTLCVACLRTRKHKRAAAVS
jgi:large subunit ribosomal protein L28